MGWANAWIDESRTAAANVGLHAFQTCVNDATYTKSVLCTAAAFVSSCRSIQHPLYFDNHLARAILFASDSLSNAQLFILLTSHQSRWLLFLIAGSFLSAALVSSMVLLKFALIPHPLSIDRQKHGVYL